MKTRTGFVSNSSSSSFIVALPERPWSVQCVMDAFFKGRTYVTYPYTDCGKDFIPAEHAAFVLYKDIDSQKRSASKKKMLQAIAGGSFEGMPEFNYSVPKEQYKEELDKYHKKVDEAAEKLLDGFMKDVRNKLGKKAKFYVLHYGDDSTFGSFMEHGTTFDDVMHLQISYH